jgi:hypothetical protein
MSSSAFSWPPLFFTWPWRPWSFLCFSTLLLQTCHRRLTPEDSTMPRESGGHLKHLPSESTFAKTWPTYIMTFISHILKAPFLLSPRKQYLISKKQTWSSGSSNSIAFRNRHSWYTGYPLSMGNMVQDPRGSGHLCQLLRVVTNDKREQLQQYTEMKVMWTCSLSLSLSLSL